jgi:hypothetical protein
MMSAVFDQIDNRAVRDLSCMIAKITQETDRILIEVDKNHTTHSHISTLFTCNQRVKCVTLWVAFW